LTSDCCAECQQLIQTSASSSSLCKQTTVSSCACSSSARPCHHASDATSVVISHANLCNVLLPLLSYMPLHNKPMTCGCFLVLHVTVQAGQGIQLRLFIKCLTTPHNNRSSDIDGISGAAATGSPETDDLGRHASAQNNINNMGRGGFENKGTEQHTPHNTAHAGHAPANSNSAWAGGALGGGNKHRRLQQKLYSSTDGSSTGVPSSTGSSTAEGWSGSSTSSTVHPASLSRAQGHSLKTANSTTDGAAGHLFAPHPVVDVHFRAFGLPLAMHAPDFTR
jgi:hypothetical protein